MNGTWLSLSDSNQRKERSISDPMQILHNDTIKISDSQLTFEMVNF